MQKFFSFFLPFLFWKANSGRGLGLLKHLPKYASLGSCTCKLAKGGLSLNIPPLALQHPQVNQGRDLRHHSPSLNTVKQIYFAASLFVCLFFFCELKIIANLVATWFRENWKLKGVLHPWALFLKTLCIFAKNKATSDKVSYGSGQKFSKELKKHNFISVETIVVKLQWKMRENQYFPCFEP